MSTLRTLAATAALASLAATTLTLAPSAGTAGRVEGHTAYATSVTQPKAVWTEADHDAQPLTKDATDTTSLPTIHSVYVHASDQPSRFADYAAYFQAEQRRASDILQSSTGMAFRWDERDSASHGRLHDITVVRAKANMRSLSSSKQFSLLLDTLTAAGLTNSNKKYYVWLDAKSTSCGQGTQLEDRVRTPANKANGRTVAVSYRPTGGEEMYASVGGWCNPVLHELTHSMGAVASWAPNAVAGGHCDDDAQDSLCNANQGPAPFDAAKPRTYDGGNDDYLDANADLALADDAGKLPWWTVNLSRFLCPRSAAVRTQPDCEQPNTPVW